MVGLVVMIGGVKTSLLAGIEVVRAALVEGASTALEPGSGRNLAYQLIGALFGGKPLRLAQADVREQLTSFGFDGQYMGPEEGNNSGLDVGGWMCRLLQIRSSLALRKWDGAHMLELAVGDARKLVLLNWWAELHLLISGVQAKYLYGKGFDRIFLAAAREMHLRGRLVKDQSARQHLAARQGPVAFRAECELADVGGRRCCTRLCRAPAPARRRPAQR
jgi:hypothetical protein